MYYFFGLISLRVWSVFQLVVGMRLVIVVAVEHRIIHQFDFLVLAHIPLLLFLLSVLLLPHRRRVRPFPLPHVLVHQSIPETIIGLLANLLKILRRAPPIQRVANRLVDQLYLLWRPDELIWAVH
jgi:hypothetical protein